PERPGGRELAELVPDHRFGDVDGHVLAAVVHRERVAHHVGGDRGPARPRLDHPAVSGRVHRVDLLLEMVVDERTFFQTAWHRLPPCPAATAAADDQLVGLLALLAGAALGLAPRRHRVPATGALPLTTTEGVVDRVHGDAPHVRALALPAVAARLADLHQAGLCVADRAHGAAAVDGHP